jgi:hypothetical protein
VEARREIGMGMKGGFVLPQRVKAQGHALQDIELLGMPDEYLPVEIESGRPLLRVVKGIGAQAQRGRRAGLFPARPVGPCRGGVQRLLEPVLADGEGYLPQE